MGSCSVLSTTIDHEGGRVGASCSPSSQLGALSVFRGGTLSVRGEVGASLCLVANCGADLGITPQINRANVGLSLVCTLERPYLEIDPEYLWILPELYTNNDIISNVFWHID